MLNPTGKIKLEKDWQKAYSYARPLIFIIFFLIGVYVFYRIVFPQQDFAFFFRTPNANRNSVTDPRTLSNEKYQDGIIKKGSGLVFDTSLSGDFSKLESTLKLEERIENNLSGKMTARKGFQAFFYPQGRPIGFEDGSLLEANGRRYMTSKGSLRMFESYSTAQILGFPGEAFIEVNEEDLTYNPAGSIITTISPHPEDTIFFLDGIYYQLKDKRLVPFLSEQAFMTRYSTIQAIRATDDILNLYPIKEEEFVGFAPGTLISAGISVFIVDKDGLLPVNNPVTFESMGYDWSEVIPASSEEYGMYEEKKLFTISNPHPDGTVFLDLKTEKYFEVQDTALRLIPSKNILATRLKTKPITASSDSWNISENCEIKRKSYVFNSYKCGMSVEKLENIPGNDYQFRTEFNQVINAKDLRVNFSQILSIRNMQKSLGLLKNRITNNYSN